MARKTSWFGTPVTHAWALVLSFFFGAVVSLIAFDLSDYVNYAAQTSGQALDAFQQFFYFALFPTILYAAIGLLAFLAAKSGKVTPWFFMYFFLVVFVLVPTAAASQLPQARDLTWDLGIVLGAIVSVLVVMGQVRQVKKAARHGMRS